MPTTQKELNAYLVKELGTVPTKHLPVYQEFVRQGLLAGHPLGEVIEQAKRDLPALIEEAKSAGDDL